MVYEKEQKRRIKAAAGSSRRAYIARKIARAAVRGFDALDMILNILIGCTILCMILLGCSIDGIENYGRAIIAMMLAAVVCAVAFLCKWLIRD